jgi:hypothetical protein
MSSTGTGPAVVTPEREPVSPVMVGLLLFTPLISTSAVWGHFGGTATLTLGLIVAGIGWLMAVEGRWLWGQQVVLGLALFATAAVPAVYWIDPRLLVYPVFLVLAVLLAGLARDREVSRFVDVASWLMLVMLVGAVAGFLLAQAGAAAIAEIINRDGRSNLLFYTTFSNLYFGNFIRPAGIYDEPGAFSFFVCAVAFLRYSTRKSHGMTWALLALGMITFSLAHLVFIAVFGLAFLGQRQLPKLAIWVALGAGVVAMTGLADTFRRYLLARVTLDTGVGIGLAGGRLQLLNNALEALRTHAHAFWVGLHPDCTFNIVRCNQIAGYIAENPLAPAAAQGIMLAWPYYGFLAVTLTAAFTGRRGLALAAVGLLFLQRPYVSAHGYALIAALALWVHFRWRTPAVPALAEPAAAVPEAGRPALQGGA